MSRMTEETDPKVEALAKVREASEAHAAAKAAEVRAREAHQAAIVAALKVDLGPSVISTVSSYDRVNIDRIRKAAKLPPKRAATVQKIPKDE
jgi:hypothetical protein